MQDKADLRLFDSRLDMKTRGTGAPWLLTIHSSLIAQNLACSPDQSSNIQRICKAQTSRANFRSKLELKGCQLGRAVADIGEATTCNRSKCGRIILISREWFPTCLIYYCPRDQHRYHPRLGLLDSKFIALSLPHSSPKKKKKLVRFFFLFDLLSTNFYTDKKKKKYNRHTFGNSVDRRVGGCWRQLDWTPPNRIS